MVRILGLVVPDGESMKVWKCPRGHYRHPRTPPADISHQGWISRPGGNERSNRAYTVKPSNAPIMVGYHSNARERCIRYVHPIENRQRDDRRSCRGDYSGRLPSARNWKNTRKLE